MATRLRIAGRSFHSSARCLSSPSSSSSTSISTYIPATSVSSVSRPGGRSSVSGIVATVFGATGFIGRYVVNNLGRIGSQVIVPYRGDGMNARHLKLSGDVGQIVPIPFDVRSAASIEKTVCRSNVVVNCLGSAIPTSNYSYDDVNVKVTYRLAQLAREAGVERFIHVSALGASADSSSAYFRSKAAGEAAVRHFFPDATIIRPAPVFGTEDKLINYYSKLAKYYISIPVVYGGKTRLQVVAVQDVARAILAATTNVETVGNTYTLTGPEIFTVNEIIARVLKHTRFDEDKVGSTNLTPNIARWYGRALSGDRPWKNVGPFARQYMPYLAFIGQILDKARFPGVFHEDLVEQLKYDLVNPNTASTLSLADLNIHTPTTLDSQIDLITQQWRRFGHESGGRFDHLGDRGASTTPLA